MMMQQHAFQHSAETTFFAVDLDPEVATEANKGATRLDVIKHAIAHYVTAKKRICSNHRFGLITVPHSTAELLPYTITSNTDEFIQHLYQLQPAAAAAGDERPLGGSSSSSKAPFDIGSLLTAVAPLQQQHNQQQQQQPDGLHICNGTLSVPSSSSRFQQQYSSNPSSTTTTSSSSSSSSNPNIRVILIYNRSYLPAPQVITNNINRSNNPHNTKINTQGFALDCLFIHGKPQPGVSNNLQDIYNALEDCVEKISMHVGHHALVCEVTAGRVNRLLSLMGSLMTHPLQRMTHSHHAAAAAAVVDLAAAPLMDLPSDAANAASGVPIVNPAKLQAAAAAQLGMSYSKAAAAPPAAAVAPAASNSAGGSLITPAAQNPWSQLGSSSSTVVGGAAAAADAAAAAAAAAGSSRRYGSSSSGDRVVEGVPADAVSGVAGTKPRYDSTTDDGVQLGYVIPTDSSGSSNDPADHVPPILPAAVVVDQSAAAAAAGTGIATMQGYDTCEYQGSHSQTTFDQPSDHHHDRHHDQQLEGLDDISDLQGLGLDEDLEDEELEGLRAALMASAVEAQMRQQQQ